MAQTYPDQGEYNDLIKTMRCYLESRVPIDSNTILKIFQFDWVVHYLPVYEVISDLIVDKQPCPIEIVSKGSDKEVVSAVKDVMSEELDGGPLVLGIGDLDGETDDDEVKDFHREYFIKRLPLWGVALVNNPEINRIKYRKKNNNGSMDYWRVFEGKLSLLERSDLQDLRLSLYPEGTTVWRMLNDYIGREDEGTDDNKPRPLMASVGLEDEFDALFRGDVDVAMSIHPWRAVNWKPGQGEYSLARYSDVELVYTHLGKPERFASLFIKKVEDPLENDVLAAFLSAFAAAVSYQVARLYENRRKDKSEPDAV